MSVNNMKLRTPVNPVWTLDFIVAGSGTNTIHRGEPTIKGEATATSTGAVLPAADGDPLPTSTHQFSGLAKNESSDAGAAGAITVWAPLPGLVYEMSAKTATDANTAAKVNALKDKRTVFDLTTTLYSVDAGAADTATSGIAIVGGDFRTSKLYFIVLPTATLWTTIAGT